MGTFAGLLGHAAGGFEEAHQADLQRQFTEEQGRRQTAHELFNALAFDPNQPDEIRNAALQGKLDLTNTPLGKAYNFQKATGPLYDLLSKHKTAQMTAANAPRQPGPITQGAPFSMPPPPPPGMATTQVPVGTHAQALPSGVAGPPQQVHNVPQISAPPHQLAFAGQSVQGPSSAPPPPPSFLAGIPQIAENEATLGAAKSGGELTGQMQARSAMADRIMQDPQYAQMIQSDPMMQQMLMSMKMGVQLPVSYYSAMTKPLVSGSEVPGSDLIAKGVTKLDDGTPVDASKFYNQRELVGGRKGYAETHGPGQQAGVGGGLVSPLQMYQQKQQAELPFYAKKVGMQLAKGIALQNNAFNLALQSGAYRDANSIFFKAQDDYIKRQGLEKQMQASYQDYLKTGSQQAQVQMLMAHVGMTTPVGGRVTRAAVEEAQESANRIGLNVAKWFHQDADGDYTFDGPKGGVNLTKPQMQQMLQLAKDRVAVQHEQVKNYQDSLPGGASTEFTAPSLSAAGTGRSKTRSGAPVPPAKKQAYQLNGKWYDAATHQEIH